MLESGSRVKGELMVTFRVQREFDGSFWTNYGWSYDGSKANEYGTESVATFAAGALANALNEPMKVIVDGPHIVARVEPER